MRRSITTAATLFTAKATKLEKQANTTQDPATKTKLTKQAAQAKKLSAILTSADTGITSYLNDAASDQLSRATHRRSKR
jgi:hypothetical protein